MLAGSHICVGFAPSVHGSCHDAASHHQESNQLSHYRGWGMGTWGAPLRDHLWQGPPVTRNAEIDPGDNDPPPKMTQGVMTPGATALITGAGLFQAKLRATRELPGE